MRRDALIVIPILGVGVFELSALHQAQSYGGNRDLIPFHLGFLAFLFGLLYSWHQGKRRSEERLQAIARGWSPTGGDGGHLRGPLVVAAGVPLGAFFLAYLATSPGHPGMSVAPWVVAGMLGMTVLVCGAGVLVCRPDLFRHEPPTPAGSAKNHVHDPDAFDVVGSRG